MSPTRALDDWPKPGGRSHLANPPARLASWSEERPIRAFLGWPFAATRQHRARRMKTRAGGP